MLWTIASLEVSRKRSVWMSPLAYRRVDAVAAATAVVAKRMDDACLCATCRRLVTGTEGTSRSAPGTRGRVRARVLEDYGPSLPAKLRAKIRRALASRAWTA